MSVSGGFVDLDGEGQMYRIADFNSLAPFLVTVTSPDDHWLFVSTSGALTAGRVSPDRALFPYETDDRLHRAGPVRAPITLVRLRTPEGTLWEPLRGLPAADVARNLYKSPLGDRLVFEEVHRAIGLTYRMRWATSARFGLVRTVSLTRHAGLEPIGATLLDGLVDIQPALAALPLVQTMSCLVDAYTRCERVGDLPLAVFGLEARIVDRAEPAEALRANLVWSVGLPAPLVCLRADAPSLFRSGQPLDDRAIATGVRGAFFVQADVTIGAERPAVWHVVGDVHADQIAVEAMAARLEAPASLGPLLAEDIADGSARLRRLVASVDGLQTSADRAQTSAHAAATLFNAMRGGLFADGYGVRAADLVAFVRTRSRATWERNAAFLEALADGPIDRVVAALEARDDPDLARLGNEYLPLWFSRRHGDPSRPWNQFAIRLTGPDGERRLDWQGNWRDIFQNWEALCESFPAFAASAVVAFVNASTADGGNPYRITRDGIDWEVPEAHNPWSQIGYWGDHQIIYLLRLLELTRRVAPGRLERFLGRAIFTYADVPYRLAPYPALRADPHDTIAFDAAHDHAIAGRVAAEGADARLLHDASGGLVRVTLAEKLLVPALAKLCNLVLDGGIWMNTQRPDWNDANNALVGWGLSVVSAAHLHRYCAGVASWFPRGGPDLHLSAEVAAWLDAVAAILSQHRPVLAAERVSDGERERLLDDLGGAFSSYRAAIYAHGLSGPVARPSGLVADLFALAVDYLAHTLRANRRDDGLYHGYNVMVPLPRGAGIALRRLPLMLEGQVAVLDSGLVDPAEAASMIEALFAGPLYRPDQGSFMLYPPVRRPGFLEKNRIPAERAAHIPLIAALLDAGDRRLVAGDARGAVRFGGDLANADDVAAVLDALAATPGWAERVAADRDAVLALWEEVFEHRVYTGRSGTMYSYEGIGSIYWHMVSKLQLAVLEMHERARLGRAGPALIERLARLYHAIRAGLGPAKSPAVQGAFPTDPHSHTPGHRGAQQPGMTGQVKEAILVRWRELGLGIEAGRVAFEPSLLPASELLGAAGELRYVDVRGAERRVEVPAGGLAFTFCQVPVVYTADADRVVVTWHWRDGRHGEALGGLDADASAALLGRTGALDHIAVRLPRAHLWQA